MKNAGRKIVATSCGSVAVVLSETRFGLGRLGELSQGRLKEPVEKEPKEDEHLKLKAGPGD